MQTNKILNELFEVVVIACDKLYTEHKLITQKAVFEIVAKHDKWTREYVEKRLPRYINKWRMQTISDKVDTAYQGNDKIIIELRDMLNKMGRTNG